MPTRLLPEGSDLDAARAALSEHLELRAGRIRAATATFYDTFDGRVYGEGLTVRHANGRLALIDRETGQEQAATEATAAAAPLRRGPPRRRSASPTRSRCAR